MGIGAGYIAVEMAQILATLGTKTTLACRGQTVLRNFDSLVSEAVTGEVEASGVTLVRGWDPAALEKTEEGLLVATSTNGVKLGPVEAVLWAVGRNPATNELGCKETGVELDSRGNVVADAFQNTSLPNVYALGDVAGKALLTPVAIAAGCSMGRRTCAWTTQTSPVWSSPIPLLALLDSLRRRQWRSMERWLSIRQSSRLCTTL